MSFLGSLEDAKKNAEKADMQIDGNDPGSTSPVMNGSSDAGGAPLSGKKEFTSERTRTGTVGQGGAMRRAYPEK